MAKEPALGESKWVKKCIHTHIKSQVIFYNLKISTIILTVASPGMEYRTVWFTAVEKFSQG